MVKIRTAAKVPTMEAGVFGEKVMKLRMEMMRKYTFAALRNCCNKLFGAQVSNVYLDVVILLEQCFCKGALVSILRTRTALDSGRTEALVGEGFSLVSST
jgi:hypothetical protein